MGKIRIPRLANASGFTVIEIVIATALLAISLATYLGVQSAIVGGVLRSRNEFTASLIARSILSGIELRGAAADLKSGDYSTEQAYEQFKLPYPDSEVERAALSRFSVKLQAEPWKLTSDVEGLTQITLDIIWGDESRDKVQYTYFIPTTNETSDE
jgi:prepilin-type N-terminal cleavage/methylation domain-containing protein